jgi:hypothetical protein
VRDKTNAAIVKLKATTGLMRRNSAFCIFKNEISAISSGYRKRLELQQFKRRAIAFIKAR